jgi:hypothetical protein
LATALEHILPDQKLRLSPFANMSDPRESSDWKFITRDFRVTLGSGAVQYNALRTANALKRTWTVLALATDDPGATPGSASVFARGFARPRMWRYYGGDHTGVCLVFDRSAMVEEVGMQLGAEGAQQWHAEPVRYTEDFDTQGVTFSGNDVGADGVEPALRRHLARHYASLFFDKNRDWATEYEFRFVVQREGDEGFLSVAVKRSLVGVVLGEQVADVYGPSIDSAIGKAGVAAGQLRWSNGEPRLDLPVWERPAWYQRGR